MSLNGLLALVDALLSAVSAALMIAGWLAIRQRRVRHHRAAMIGATVASAAFMAVFVVRFVRFGFAKFTVSGAWRAVYLAVFFTHEPLAVVNVPLVLCALVLGLMGSYRAHREVARMALPIWLYVALTGVILYALLYRFPRG